MKANHNLRVKSLFSDNMLSVYGLIIFSPCLLYICGSITSLADQYIYMLVFFTVMHGVSYTYRLYMSVAQNRSSTT